MDNTIKKIKINIFKNRGSIVIILLVFSLLIPSFLLPQVTQANKKQTVLAASVKVASSDQVPTPTVTPIPTIFLPTPTSIPTVTPTPILIPTSTPTPTPTSSVAPTSTPTPAPVVNTPTPTPTLILTSTPTPTPTVAPTPAGLKIQIGIDYAGQRASDSYSITVNQGQSAWDAVVAAVGINNLQYTDYGGSMGIFITGFNGITATSNQYFEFRVNGVSSNVGVSGYKCNDSDKLDFVLTSF